VLPVSDTRGAVEVSLRRSTLRFEQAALGSDSRYHFAINIPPGSIDDAAAWVEERHDVLAFHGDPDVEEGATIVHKDRGASALYFLDAGGNVVELIANDHLDYRPEAAFGPQSLCEVAEIGLATADTEATRNLIQETLAADILWGGQEGWLLIAIGDDHGVVIVAPVGRGWIPHRNSGAPPADHDHRRRPAGPPGDSPRAAIPHPSCLSRLMLPDRAAVLPGSGESVPQAPRLRGSPGTNVAAPRPRAPQARGRCPSRRSIRLARSQGMSGGARSAVEAIPTPARCEWVIPEHSPRSAQAHRSIGR
jgi:hypothetical protein